MAADVAFGAANIVRVDLPEGAPRLTITPFLDRLYDAGIANAIADTTLHTTYATLSAWLALPLVDADEAQRRLMASLGDDGLPISESDGYTWPLTNARELWAVAAWETYCMNGSREWLEKACKITEQMLAADSAVAFRSDLSLMCGTILDPDPLRRVIHPSRVDYTAQFESMCLANNAATVAAYDALANMLGQLGRKADSARRRAREVAEAINRRLWNPEKGFYSQYLYGGQFTMQSPATDNFGQALAILAGVPIPEMARMALRKSPMVAGGPSASQPSAVGTQPYGLHESWPAVQTMWSMAAAAMNDAPAFNFAAASLIAHATGTDKTADRTGVAIMLLRGLAGISSTAERLEFHPFLTRGFNRPIRIENLRYRDVTLDVEISGTGDKIARFAVDSVETTDYFIPATLTGRHSVDITLANNSPAIHDVAIEPQTWLPPVPEINWPNPRKAEIVDFKPGSNYMIYLNAIPFETVATQSYTTPDVEGATYIALTEINQREQQGYAGKPRLLLPRGTLTTLQVEEFALPGTSLVRERRLSQRFVESAPHSSTATINLEITEAIDRNCLIDVCYANGNGLPADGSACAVRVLTVNGRQCGSFVLPARGDGWWLSTGFSNTLSCQLHRGLNSIQLSVPNDGEQITALIDYIRIIRL
ncbi:MAG: hypothetical protein NC131_14535 [Roseburia sp.]|nr:hypothetical protein [Roseburia sp.]